MHLFADEIYSPMSTEYRTAMRSEINLFEFFSTHKILNEETKSSLNDIVTSLKLLKFDIRYELSSNSYYLKGVLDIHSQVSVVIYVFFQITFVFFKYEKDKLAATSPHSDSLRLDAHYDVTNFANFQAHLPPSLQIGIKEPGLTPVIGSIVSSLWHSANNKPMPSVSNPRVSFKRDLDFSEYNFEMFQQHLMQFR